MTLLSTVYHNNNLREKIDAKTTKNLSNQICQILGVFVKGDKNLKHKMLCELLHLIFGLHLSGSKSVDWDKMKELLSKLREKVPKGRNFHEVKRAFNKISAPLKIQVVQGNEKKRKASESLEEATENNDDTKEILEDEVEESESNSEKKKKKKKKKKGGKEALQKKKEKKKFDLEEQYENVQLPSFKGALVDTINAEDEIETPKKKKKKA